MIKDLSLFKANSYKTFFIQVMVWNFKVQKLCRLDNPENTHRFQLAVSPFGLQVLAQCNYSYNDLLSAKVLERHFFNFSEDITLTKIDNNRVEFDLHVSLKHHDYILGHCEQIHT